MKPDWDKLMTEFKDNDKIGVFDVDCTAAGKPLCDSNGVKGFPTIKYGDPDDLEDYQGGRDYAALSKFAGELKPLCSPKNMDLCDDEAKAKIEKIQGMSLEELDAQIAAADKKAQDAEDTFSAELEKLQASYKKLMEDKDNVLAEVKASGVGLLKSVRAAKKAAPKDEL
jgi:hypothetical protein